MLRTRQTAVLLLTQLALCVPLAGQTWGVNFEHAQNEAQRRGVPILANFTGSDWCTYCQRLDQEVFSTSEFRSWARDHAVLLTVDFPRTVRQSDAIRAQNQRLQNTYGVDGFPTVLFLDAGGRKLLASGYRRGGPAAWIRDVEEQLKKVVPARAAPARTGWLTSFEEALALSKASGKPILADFNESDYCGWCKRLRRDVFETPEFMKWAKSNVILLDVDFPRNATQPDEIVTQNRTLRDRYRVTGFPTVLFLGGDQQRRARMGYERGGAKVWIKKAESRLGRGESSE